MSYSSKPLMIWQHHDNIIKHKCSVCDEYNTLKYTVDKNNVGVRSYDLAEPCKCDTRPADVQKLLDLPKNINKF